MILWKVKDEDLLLTTRTAPEKPVCYGMTLDLLAWLEENDEKDNWYDWNWIDGWIHLKFKSRDSAILFKLTFGGHEVS